MRFHQKSQVLSSEAGNVTPRVHALSKGTASIQFQPLLPNGNVEPVCQLHFLKRNQKPRFECEISQFLKRAGQTCYVRRLNECGHRATSQQLLIKYKPLILQMRQRGYVSYPMSHSKSTQLGISMQYIFLPFIPLKNHFKVAKTFLYVFKKN